MQMTEVLVWSLIRRAETARRLLTLPDDLVVLWWRIEVKRRYRSSVSGIRRDARRRRPARDCGPKTPWRCKTIRYFSRLSTYQSTRAECHRRCRVAIPNVNVKGTHSSLPSTPPSPLAPYPTSSSQSSPYMPADLWRPRYNEVHRNSTK